MFGCIMENGNENRLSSSSLETIPEEANDLPRISELIPKSPETRKKEQENLQLYETHKERIETFLEMLVVQRNIKRICTNDRHSTGNYSSYNARVKRPHSTTPTLFWFQSNKYFVLTKRTSEWVSVNYKTIAWRFAYST